MALESGRAEESVLDQAGAGFTMTEDRLRSLLGDLREGRVSIDDAVAQLRRLPVESLGFANVDHHRALRCGFPEVIFGGGKTSRQIVRIFESVAAHGHNVLATRVKDKAAKLLLKRFPRAVYHEAANCVALRQQPSRPTEGIVAIITAGTSDIPVAEEARVTADIMDARVETHYDVGVAGLHRLLLREAELRRARVVVVVAGMEGALLSVVGGLMEAPVIGVPTSVGYGASLGGVAPLLTMLNSCAAGTAVVNIDNGFGAGYLAALISRLGESPAAEQKGESQQPATEAPAESGAAQRA